MILSEKIISAIKKEATDAVVKVAAPDLVSVILYGSCARGDYSDDSDIDIALLLKCNRIEAKKYNTVLASISTELAMKYYQVINFVCLPYKEFNEKKDWYPYYNNIVSEGQILYG